MVIKAAASAFSFEFDAARNRRFLQYLLVGAVGVGINQGTLFLATGVVGLSYLIGGFLGQVVSLSINYAINDRWTWAEHGKPGFQPWVWRGMLYGGTRVVGIAIHLIALMALVELFELHYLVANLVAIGVGVLWGFGASDVLIWNTNGDRPLSEQIRDSWKRLGTRIDRSTKHILLLTLVSFLGFSVYTILLYWSYWMTGGDFGSYVHAFETTKQGTAFLHTGRYRIGNPTSTYWGEHFSLTLLAVYPIYWLFPYQETLLVVKSAVLASSIPLLWIVAREHISLRLSKFAVVLYVLNPFFHSAWIFDFQEQMFLPALIFGAYLSYRRDHHLLFLLLIGAILLTNEFLVFIMAGTFVGLAVTTVRSGSRTKRDWGVVIGMAVLIVAIHVVAGLVIARYNQFTGIPVTAVAEPYRPFLESERVSTGGLVSLLISHWELLWQSLSTDMMTKTTYFVLLLVPVAFVSLFDEIAFFSLAPYLGFAWVFSGSSVYYMFGAHYPLYLIPFLFIGLVRVIGRFSQRRESRLLIKRLFLVLLALSLLISVSGMVERQAIPRQTDHMETLSAGIDSIPPEASLVTQNDLYPHVADRPDALFIASAPTYYEYKSMYGVSLPDYVLFDTKLGSKPLDWSIPIQQSYRNELTDEYSLYRYEDDVWIFKKGYDGSIKGITDSYRAPSKTYGVSDLQTSEGVVYDNKIESGTGNVGDVVWFGPYDSLPKGTYEITFLINVGPGVDSEGVALEVIRGFTHELVTSETVGPTDGWKRVTLTVTFEEYATNLEFRGKRVSNTGAVAIRRISVDPVSN